MWRLVKRTYTVLPQWLHFVALVPVLLVLWEDLLYATS